MQSYLVYRTGQLDSFVYNEDNPNCIRFALKQTNQSPLHLTSQSSAVSSPLLASTTLTKPGLNAFFKMGMLFSGWASPHMNTSKAAYPLSGHEWMEMWLSLNTSTPEIPPLGSKLWRWQCKMVAPDTMADSLRASSITSALSRLVAPHRSIRRWFPANL